MRKTSWPFWNGHKSICEKLQAAGWKRGSMQCAPKTALFPQRKLKSRLERSLPLPFIFLDTPMGCVVFDPKSAAKRGNFQSRRWTPVARAGESAWCGVLEGWEVVLEFRWGLGMDMCGRTQVDVGWTFVMGLEIPCNLFLLECHLRVGWGCKISRPKQPVGCESAYIIVATDPVTSRSAGALLWFILTFLTHHSTQTRPFQWWQVSWLVIFADSSKPTIQLYTIQLLYSYAQTLRFAHTLLVLGRSTKVLGNIKVPPPFNFTFIEDLQ